MEKESFDDLLFDGNKNARLYFENGYGVSVSFRSNLNNEKRSEQQYSISILKGKYIDMDNPLTKDLIDYKTKEDIEKIINLVKNYKK